MASAGLKRGEPSAAVRGSVRAASTRSLLLTPSLLIVLVLLLYPLVQILGMSVGYPHFSLANYVDFFSQAVYLRVLYTTVKIAVVVTVVSLLLAYPVAYLLAISSPRKVNFLMIFVLLPFWTSLLARTYSWMLLLGRTGVINQVLIRLGLVTEPVKLIYNTVGVVLAMTHILLPFMILPLYGVLKRMDWDLVRAAYNLGAGPLAVFRKVIFPLTLPGVAAGCLLVFIQALGYFITPALLGGPRDMMLAQLVEQHIRLFNWPFAATESLVLLVATFGIVAVFNRFLGLDRLWRTYAS